jgi:hypothetical protein
MDSGGIGRPQTFKSNIAMQQRMHTCRNQEKKGHVQDG